MIHTNHNFRIIGTGSYAPSNRVPNVVVPHANAEWVKESLGIESRHLVGEYEYSSDLAYHAADRALINAGIDPDRIDLTIVATATPDRKAPSTACLVQDRLNIRNHSPAYDLSAVCSGFLYALTTASQALASSDAHYALVIGADTFSRITDWSHRDCVFFGDGAGAVVIEKAPGFFSSELYADGSGKDNFTVKPEEKYYRMNGRAVYETGTKVLPAAILSLLSKHNLTVEDIDHIVPHQPSIRVLRKTAEVLGVPFEKVHTNMQEYANTAGATVPLLFDHLHRANTFKSGELVVFATVGSGWAWGAGLYRWM